MQVLIVGALPRWRGDGHLSRLKSQLPYGCVNSAIRRTDAGRGVVGGPGSGRWCSCAALFPPPCEPSAGRGDEGACGAGMACSRLRAHGCGGRRGCRRACARWVMAGEVHASARQLPAGRCHGCAPLRVPSAECAGQVVRRGRPTAPRRGPCRAPTRRTSSATVYQSWRRVTNGLRREVVRMGHPGGPHGVREGVRERPPGRENRSAGRHGKPSQRTVSEPFIVGWMVQMYGYEPGRAGASKVTVCPDFT